jgi:glutamate synthase domain-containing protein 2/glutamate synthase domain-containing protein 1/glutamate synthase domain-containing protein 3
MIFDRADGGADTVGGLHHARGLHDARGLYDPTAERDACGIGFVADAEGRAARAIVDAALDGLCGVRHRGAVASDSKTGDGAGILLPLPRTFMAAEADRLGGTVDPGDVGVAMCFFSGDDSQRGSDAHRQAREVVEEAVKTYGLFFIAWRTVPTTPDALGDQARAAMPTIEQALFTAGDAIDPERAAYLARRRAERRCAQLGVAAYFASFSFATVTYKALSAADQLAAFYPDLCAEAFVAPYVMFHQRYSTNTLPTWDRAQPFRLLCHNGEINTINGNVNLMRARTGNLGADWPELGDRGEAALEPLIDEAASDSAKLDSALELLLRGGRSIDHAMAMLVPQVWEGSSDLPPAVRDFYRYHAALVEPWDGPAGLVFADGTRVGAALDRNGLRPLRYLLCDDGLIVCGSEVGAVRTAGRGGVRRERLGPGEMVLFDPAHGVIENAALKRRMAARRPYGDWLQTHQRTIDGGQPVGHAPDDLLARQIQAGFTKEEQTAVLRPLANDGKEPVSSMGDDTPLAVLSDHARTIYHYLKQRFAQVTNPPIDHLREWKVMSLRTQLGPRAPILSEEPTAVQLLELDGFVLYPQGLRRLLMEPDLPFVVAGLDATFPVDAGAEALAARLRGLAVEAVEAVRSGAALLVCSDRKVGPERAAVPALLAVGSVHHALVDARLRTHTSLICETDDARETHAFATLLGYGADAICPRLALETITELADAGRLGRDSASAGEAQEAYVSAVSDGVLKIMSKMGISTLDSYRSAQVFEAIGLGPDVIDRCLRGTPSQLGGIGLRELGEDVIARHELAHTARPVLSSPGFYKFKRSGEYHANNPQAIDVLHRSIGLVTDDGEPDPPPSAHTDATTAEQRAAHLLAVAADTGRAALYDEYARTVNARPPSEPRDLLEPAAAATAVALDEVEPVTSIVQRFFTGAMSLGALSPESHETLAIAMNLLGASSNTGEGGEDPRRFTTRGSARDANSRSKQVASGRFGVTPQYLAYADEVQIKMAQGSKPGEGGHLPGHKVSSLIARLRHTQPGVSLISPPPHHDIYSIEDLAQLIFDLKQVNPFASVSVKLVASDGVGVVAAGVVKGLADAVQIAGCDGGTGASPLSSIKHAGLPWELGLAETQQTLVANGLRGRVRLQVDGGFRTGRDVLIAALLGADEYGFGTAVLLAEGCIMARACHRDTCPVGVATQRRDLRDKYVGTPETVATYVLFVAEEVRAGLAALGARSVDEVIGRTDLLRPRALDHERSRTLDMAPLLVPPRPGPRHYEASQPIQAPRDRLGDEVFDAVFRALWAGTGEAFDFDIRNTDRAVGARLGGAIGLEFGDRMPEQPVTVRFTGEGGQSFGAFLAQGVEFELTGEANDYVGKGMAGGRIVVRPPEDDRGDPVLVGNTVLYGATGGALFVAGRAGERFAVRNSGADAVVEGTGEHACEYMTGGVVVILGPTGFNLGAGMTGGVCYVHDPGAAILARINTQLVEARRLEGGDLDDLLALVSTHADVTGSQRARALLDDWDRAAQGFWRIAPRGRLARFERSDRGVGTSV